ncbi:response regulator transcription factor [Ktedonobacter racemifer]|uniref:Two component transcriptional regulator, LuxR family n=1 Tax=Ktedonobacter racemifer DSM 44963 TaxID=485913 RepID=D6TIF4_KTERA|nr:response regulator transcription factor [Ktedonobacter racemifer]EFH89211.1 two component transcriptional regulator, LuxR family [Ktedonobacter racemifer DSM 44963]
MRRAKALSCQADFEVVGEATHGQEAIELITRLKPDVIIMDLRMAKMGGAEAITGLRQLGITIPILVLTTYDSNADILHAVKAGATGYILKDAPREQLFAAIRTVAQGKSVFAPEVVTRLLRHMQTPPSSVLSERELEVLALVGRGASNKEAARSLFISEATIKSHLLRIFGKLGVEDRTAAVTVALEKGMLHLNEEK